MNSIKKFKISVFDLVKDTYLMRLVNSNFVKIFYKRKGRGSDPKPFIVPRVLEIDEEFMEAIGMYVGDGKLSNDKHHLEFTSIDPDMIKFMLNFFRKRLNLKNSDIRFLLTYKNGSENPFRNWVSYLGIPSSEIHTAQSDRHRNESFSMQIGGLIFRYFFGEIVKKLLAIDLLEDAGLRRGFLRGLYAAEGGMGVVKSQNYIAYIAFHFSYENEQSLSALVKRLLSMEGISSREIIRKDKGERYLQITNWRNYHLCWKIDLFRLNKRKELKFLRKLKITRFSCSLGSKLRRELLFQSLSSTRELALRLGVSEANVRLLRRGKTSFFNIEYLIKLAQMASIPLSEIKNSLIEFRVNDVTRIDDRDFIDFAFGLKSCR